MKRFLIAAAATIALFASGGIAYAAGPEDLRPWLPEIRDSSELSGGPLVSGQVVDNNGRAFDAALPIVMYLWPGESVLGAMEVGDGVKVTPVAKAVTQLDGTFELRLSDAASVVRMSSAEQFLDLEIVAETPHGRAPYSFSLTPAELSDPRGELARKDAVGRAQTHGLTIEPISVLDFDPAPGSVQGPPSDADQPADGDQIGKLYCEWVLVQNLGNRTVNVGVAYMTTSGVTHDFRFTNGSTMTMGIGYSATSATAGFSQSGTSTRTTSGTVDYPSHTGTNNHRIFKTYYLYGTYRERCQTSATSGWYWANNWETRPRSWAAGAPTSLAASAPSTPSSYCTPFPATATFTKNATKAYTWSGGVNTSTYIGIGLSSQSGWNTQVSSVWTFNSSGKKLCGTNDAIGGAPVRLVARSV